MLSSLCTKPYYTDAESNTIPTTQLIMITTIQWKAEDQAPHPLHLQILLLEIKWVMLLKQL